MSAATKEKTVAEETETEEQFAATPNPAHQAALQQAADHLAAALGHDVEPPAEDKPKKLTTDERLDLLEAGLTVGLNIDLSKYDPETVVAARADAVRKAAEAMAKIADQAAAEIGKDLTTAERIERLENAARSRGTLI